MYILDKIVAHKQKEIQQKKALVPIALLESSLYFPTPTVSLSHYIKREDKNGIIAEFKRRSPSNPDINLFADVEEVSIGYMQAGASALSILTDEQFFGGCNLDLTAARKFNFAPVLRKDFIVDEYQIVEAKSIGADAILLIADCLSKQEVGKLSQLAHHLGLEVLFEIREATDLDKLSPNIDLIGVNNRNLHDFSISLDRSRELSKLLPAEMVKISESGIQNPADVIDLQEHGYDGFLIGSLFMNQPSPKKQCQGFIQGLNAASVSIKS